MPPDYGDKDKKKIRNRITENPYLTLINTKLLKL